MGNTNIPLAIEYLDEFGETLDIYIKNGKLDNRAVIGLSKGWLKITVVSGLSLQTLPYLRMKQVPPKLAGKLNRLQVLDRASDEYENTLKNGPPNVDKARATDEALRYFVWDYRQEIASNVNRETDFVTQINALIQEGEKGVMQERVFKADQ
jgi:hypothetical protein